METYLDNGSQQVRFLLVGVGGQGTILASDILAEVGLRSGYDVKKAEIHGMSQRGGSVVSNVVWAPQVFSPIIPRGKADILLAFEKLEAARFSEYLRPGGLAIVNDYAILPVTVTSGPAEYPDNQHIRSRLTQMMARQVWVDGVGIAERLGNARAANVVLIGALTAVMGISVERALEAIEARVPAKHLEINRKAFEAGRNSVA